MMNYHVFFDKAHTQVGFGPINTCPQIGFATTSPTTTGTTAAGSSDAPLSAIMSISVVVFLLFVVLF